MVRPPVVLVHGAANSSGVWRFWLEHLTARGHSCLAPDLRGHGHAACADLSRVVMSDYVEDVSGAVRDLSTPPVVVGWSMGGLVALMYGVTFPTAGVIALGPSMPGQLLESPSREPLVPGVFGPEVYGITDRAALAQPTMPDLDPEETRIALASVGLESSMARQDRRRGIPLDPDAMSGPALIVAGERDTIMPPSACRRLADFLNGSLLEFSGASHWGLVLSRRALDAHLPEVFQWLEALG